MTAGRPIRLRKSATPPTQHRAQHGCGAYPYDNGPLLGALAAAAHAQRILELGTRARLHRIVVCPWRAGCHGRYHRARPEHVRLARENIAAAALDHRITVHEGDFASVLPTLDPGYDVAFFDGHTPVPALHKTLRGLLRTGGMLITANLNHGGTAERSARRCSTANPGAAR